MKNKAILCVSAAVVLLTSSCMLRFTDAVKELEGKNLVNDVVEASSSAVSIEMSLENFTAVKMNGSADIEYSYGEPSIEITGPENVVELVECKVENGKLDIHLKKGVSVSNNHKGLKFKLQSNNLENLSIAGSSNVKIEGINEDSFGLALTGSGNVDIDGMNADKAAIAIAGSGTIDIKNLNSNKISGSIAGAGSIKIEGKANRAGFSVLGSGSVDTKNLQCGNLTVND